MNEDQLDQLIELKAKLDEQKLSHKSLEDGHIRSVRSMIGMQKELDKKEEEIKCLTEKEIKTKDENFSLRENFSRIQELLGYREAYHTEAKHAYSIYYIKQGKGPTNYKLLVDKLKHQFEAEKASEQMIHTKTVAEMNHNHQEIMGKMKSDFRIAERLQAEQFDSLESKIEERDHKLASFVSAVETLRTFQIGDVLMIPLSNPAWHDGSKKIQALYQAIPFPEVPKGWSVTWDGRFPVHGI